MIEQIIDMPEFLTIPDNGPIFIIDRNKADINFLENLIHCKPGSILLIDDLSAIQFIPPQLVFEHFGFIAGMTSENP